MKVKLKGNQCPSCMKTHEVCADGKKCDKWRVSYEVCVVFGTRAAKKFASR